MKKAFVSFRGLALLVVLLWEGLVVSSWLSEDGSVSAPPTDSHARATSVPALLQLPAEFLRALHLQRTDRNSFPAIVVLLPPKSEEAISHLFAFVSYLHMHSPEIPLLVAHINSTVNPSNLIEIENWSNVFLFSLPASLLKLTRFPDPGATVAQPELSNSLMTHEGLTAFDLVEALLMNMCTLHEPGCILSWPHLLFEKRETIAILNAQLREDGHLLWKLQNGENWSLFPGLKGAVRPTFLALCEQALAAASVRAPDTPHPTCAPDLFELAPHGMPGLAVALARLASADGPCVCCGLLLAGLHAARRAHASPARFAATRVLDQRYEPPETVWAHRCRLRHRYRYTTEECMRAAAQPAPRRNNTQDVAVLFPTISKWDGVAGHAAAALSLHPVRELLPSLFRTVAPSLALQHFRVVVYVGYDIGDPFFDAPALRAQFQDIVLGRLAHGLPPGSVALRMTPFPRTRGNTVYMWNHLAFAAVRDGCEYLYQVCDDFELHPPQRATPDEPGWLDTFVRVLRSSPGLPNIGAVAPYPLPEGATPPPEGAAHTYAAHHEGVQVHDRGYPAVSVAAFVHRTHMAIHGNFFPRVFWNWYADDWMTSVYRNGVHMVVPFHIPFVHREKLRYAVCADRAELEETVRAGQAAVAAYIQAHSGGAPT